MWIWDRPEERGGTRCCTGQDQERIRKAVFVYMNTQKHVQFGIGVYGMDNPGIEYNQLISGQGKCFLIDTDGDASVQTEQNFHSIMPVHGNVRAFKRCHGNLNSKISHRMQGFVVDLCHREFLLKCQYRCKTG